MYQRPGLIVRRLANPAIEFVVARLGLSPQGTSVLAVRRRSSGGEQTVPVLPLDIDGARYLVAPRGNTQWARNLQAAGEGELRVGRRRERFTAAAVPDAEKPPILRAYLTRWGIATKAQFGVGADASEAELARIAPDHPVFRITTR